MDGSKLFFLVSQYGILERLAQNLSTLDLLNLALTCKELYAHIRASNAIFERLKRVALCDGHGLKARQEYAGFYSLMGKYYNWLRKDLRHRVSGCLFDICALLVLGRKIELSHILLSSSYSERSY